MGRIIGGEKTLLNYTTNTGTEAGGQGGVEVWPNPTTGQFKIQSLKLKVKEAEFEIFDLNDRKLLQKFIPAGTETIEIDVSNLQNGVYFSRLISDNKFLTRKLNIQK
ncbi:MAG: T9SS type A sorting domain-containing protein [Lentimicrobium sp.]|nr:T9SS type A sorting domain-containing protein [Lentimicrobium sp.]